MGASFPAAEGNTLARSTAVRSLDIDILTDR